MRTVLLASLRTNRRRYLAAVLAVVIGVAFIVVTGLLASATRTGLTAGIAAPYEHADAIVDRPDVDTAVAVLADGGAAATGWAILPVSKAGRQLSATADVGPVADVPALRWQPLTEGRFPAAPGEAVADVDAAGTHDIVPGDVLRIGRGGAGLDVTVVGLVESPSELAAASVYVPFADLLRWRDDLAVTSVAVAGRSVAEVRAAHPDATVEPVDSWVDARHAEVAQGVDVVAIMLLLFSAIALFVSVLVIANTFSILFAQRMRELALLRCVGVTRRQLRRAMRLEALAVGIGASLLGLVAGTALGHGVLALVRAGWPQAPIGGATLSPLWYAAAGIVGVTVTAVAAWLPTRRALRVSPLAALRPELSVEVRTTAGRLRSGAAVALILGGSGLLVAAAANEATPAMLAGGGAVFLGVLLLGPWLVPALVRSAGRLLGPLPRLAADNAVRNPRRAATTTASLLVGVTLTTAVLTGMATTRDGLGAEMDRQHPIDVALTSPSPLPDTLVERARATDGVERAVALPGVTTTVAGRPLTLLAPADEPGLLHEGVTVRPGVLRVPFDLLGDDLADGATVTVTAGDRTAELTVRGGEGWGEAGLVSGETLERLTTAPAAYALWVRATDGADPERLGGDLGVLAPDADVENGLARRAWVDLQLDVLTGTVVGLLGIAVLIALVGIGNTLGLSVLERSREHALLRALGLNRRQLRRLLAAEGLLLSLVATVVGTVLGVAFAVVGVETLVRPVLDDVALVLPGWQLALVALVAGTAGLLSCVVPARRAARVTPAAGLALD